MNVKLDQHVYLSLKKKLEELHQGSEKYTDKKMAISDIESIVSCIHEFIPENQKTIRKHLSSRLSFSYLCISCLFYFAMSVDTACGLFPKGFLLPNSSVSPNLVFYSLLTNITNLSISIIVLIEHGQDNSARTLLRSLIESCWQTTILHANKEDLVEYIKGASSEKETNKTWHKLFSKGRIKNKLIKIDDLLGFSKSLSEKVENIRNDNYKFFSMSTHNACITTMVNSYAWPFKGSTACSSALLGRASSSSEATINTLNDTLWHFVIYFVAIHCKIHKMSVGNPKQAFWYEAVTLYRCIIDLEAEVDTEVN